MTSAPCFHQPLWECPRSISIQPWHGGAWRAPRLSRSVSPGFSLWSREPTPGNIIGWSDGCKILPNLWVCLKIGYPKLQVFGTGMICVHASSSRTWNPNISSEKVQNSLPNQSPSQRIILRDAWIMSNTLYIYIYICIHIYIYIYPVIYIYISRYICI